MVEDQVSLTGRSIIAGWDGAGSGESVRAVDPASGAELDPEFAFVTEVAVDAAAGAARAAFDVFRETSPSERAGFLETIAANLDACRDEIVARACLESGLPRARIEGEHGRTTGQIRLFAREVRLGSHQGVRIDEAQPDRVPLPGPDVRQRHIGVGPVAVFGPSNFPLAFSATGGDVAAALAAGCPVIVKAHNAHPGTAELAGSAVEAAVEACGLPGGVYSLLFGAGRVVGQALAAHPAIKAIAFTGSQAGGTAPMGPAAGRRPAPRAPAPRRGGSRSRCTPRCRASTHRWCWPGLPPVTWRRSQRPMWGR
ncbi:MAG: aldehyde dehydrogenase family protein [Acidimicrobiaceae bacterium]|nr:aldehyde dehydrogenase family protein [Acidimicrobiaceae bacterium]